MQSTERNTTGKFLDDSQSMRAIVSLLQPPLRELYDSYGSLSLEAVFPNRKLVCYTLQADQPTNVETWSFGDLFLNRDTGPMSSFTREDGSVVNFTVLPVKVPGRDVFVQMPQTFELKWKGKDSPRAIQFVPHFACLLKTVSRVNHQLNGHTYVETLNKFRGRFPVYPLRY